MPSNRVNSQFKMFSPKATTDSMRPYSTAQRPMTALRATQFNNKAKMMERDSSDTLPLLNPKVGLHQAPRQSSHSRGHTGPPGNDVITIDKVTPELAA